MSGFLGIYGWENAGRKALALACLLLGMVCAHGFSQGPKSQFQQSRLTAGMEAVLNLGGIWFDENGNRHIVPFNLADRDHMEMRREFDLPGFEQVQDTLYLYCEALAWTSEVMLNDRLLAVTEDPFAEHLFPIQKAWLAPTGNKLVVKLSTEGVDFPWYPKRFLGIFRQIFLLQAADAPVFARFPEHITHAPKAALIAPWSQQGQYVDDTTVIRKMVMGLFSYPHRHPVAFPFRPSNRSMAILAENGWQVLVNPGGADSLAAYNYYALSTNGSQKALHFWRDAAGRPTGDYGRFQAQAAIGRPEFVTPSPASLIIFLGLPVLCMFLLKLLAPKAYGNLGEYVTKTKIYLELIADNKFLKVEQRWLMNAMRMIVTSVTVSLYLYYVQLSESWQVLNVFASRSILFRSLYGADLAVWEIFLWTFAVVAGLNLAKYFLINAVGTVFRVFTLAPTIQNLDVFASFPMNLVPYLPATFIFFLDPVAGGIVLRVWMVILVLYGARRVWLVYNGLARLYQVSGSLKFLYICTLEILPWAILI